MYPPVVCITPFGFPVEPLVYKINRGSSASISSGAHSEFAELIDRLHEIKNMPINALLAVDEGTYKNLPFSMPQFGHQILTALNSLTELVDLKSKKKIMFWNNTK